MHCSLRCFESFITTKKSNYLVGEKKICYKIIYFFVYMYDPQHKKVNQHLNSCGLDGLLTVHI